MLATDRVAKGIVLLFITTQLAAGSVDGLWRLHAGRNGSRLVQMMWGTGDDHNSSSIRLTPQELEQVTGAASAAIVRREAGTIELVRSSSKGIGGDFSFTPDPAYLARLHSAGVRIPEKRRGSSDEELLLSFAIFDVTTAFVRELQTLGYRNLSPDDLLAMRVHGVDGAFIRSLHRAGYSDVRGEDLVAMKIHGVSPRLAEELKLLGLGNVSAKDLVAAAIHRVTPEFAREMKELDVQGLTLDSLVAMRIHNVTPAFVRDLRTEGLVEPDADDLVSMRIHGIDSRSARAMKRKR
jgi:hypothetical protein